MNNQIKQVIGATVLFVAMAMNVNAQNAAAPSWAAKAQKAIVSVITYDKDNQMLHSGTGFFVANGEAVADYSLFKEAYSAVVVSMDGQKSNVERILGADDTYSLVRFKVDSKKNESLEFSAANPSSEAMVFALSYSKDKIKTCPSATVSSTKTITDGCPYYTISQAFPEEYMGAPVFNNKGQLIGTVQPSVGSNGYVLGQQFIKSLVIKPIASKVNSIALNNIHIKKGLPDNPEEALVYLYIKSRSADNDTYLDILDLFISTYPDNAEGYYRRATPYTDLHRFDEADNDLQTFLKLSKDKAYAKSKIADAIYTKLVYQPTPEYEKWSYDVALQYINDALAEQADNLDYKLLKTQILMSKKDYASALELYTEINNSTDRSPATLYAECLARQGMGDSLSVQVELLDSAIAMFGTPMPAEAANYVMFRGKLYASAGRYRDAVTDYNQYCYLNNNKVSDAFYYDRSQLELQGKMYQQSLDDLNTAISLAPRQPLYYIEKGALLIRVNELDECITTLKQALQLSPNSPDAYRMLGYAQVQKGDKVEGRKNLDKAVSLGDESAKEVIEKYIK